MLTKVWQRLNVGSLDDAKRLATANPSGIKTVVTFCHGEVLPQAQGIEYLYIPIADCVPIPVKRFEEIMKAITENIRKGGVLLHCAAGMSRAPVLCAAFMNRCGYSSFDSALAELERLRPTIDPAPILLRSIKELL